MHMPTKWGLLVCAVVAVCLGAYYVFVASPVRVGPWEVYQGTARPIEDPNEPLRGRGAAVDISYTVRRPGMPLFRYEGLMNPLPTGSGPRSMALTYRSEWPTRLRVVLWQDDRAYEAHAVIEHADDWKTVFLEEPAFVRRDGAASRVDLRRIRPRIDFYDGSGVTQASTKFSNRIQLAPIWFKD